MTLQETIKTTLADLGIVHQSFTHPAVFTCEEADRLCPPMPGRKSKNLFLRDKKGERYFFVATTYEKRVDLKQLSERLEVRGLSFASPERLHLVLGVEPGSVGLLALIHDTNHLATVYLDRELADADLISSHPGVNTETLVFSPADLRRFFAHTGHAVQVIDFEKSA